VSQPKRHATWWLALCIAAPASAGSLNVKVLDDHGQPVAGVAVYAVPADAGTSAPAATPQDSPTATMDQAHNAFVPHVLIVQAGTSVLFPNNDVVSHHVYSFSDAKAFEFPLYKATRIRRCCSRSPGSSCSAATFTTACSVTFLVVDTPALRRHGPQWGARTRGAARR
jgi:plastocyanin